MRRTLHPALCTWLMWAATGGRPYSGNRTLRTVHVAPFRTSHVAPRTSHSHHPVTFRISARPTNRTRSRIGNRFTTVFNTPLVNRVCFE